MALPIFAFTLFVSAFLLFLVQPMIGKLILPKLGGTPQVWNTCMVFFQTVLLLGYAYTHTVSTKLKLRQQLMLHGAILAIPIILVAMFPFYDTVRGWAPPTEGNPIPQTLLLLATVVGIPFFVVSTSAPLLQKWFAYSGDPAAKDPYFLYGASNAGSLLSLLFYPIVIEPNTFLATQSTIWFVGYIALAAVVLYCAFTIYKVAPADSQLAYQPSMPQPEPLPGETPPIDPAPVAPAQASTALKSGPAPAAARGIQRKKGMKAPVGKADEDRPLVSQGPPPMVNTGATAPMTAWRRIRWVLLAAVPSSLMLGVTSYISTDLSPFPLLWIVPLSLYLLSFILVYMKMWTGKYLFTFGGHWYTLHDLVLFIAQPMGLIVLCFLLMKGGFDPVGAPLLAFAGFFATALACHGELAKDRPSTQFLTEYFLLMSVGGAIGGTFNAIIAPIVFQHGVIEFHIIILVACFIRPQYVQSGWFDELILNAFPQFQSWVRMQGDEMARSMNRPAPRSTYLFNYFLDIVFGLFILCLSYWLRLKYIDATRFRIEATWLGSVIKFFGLGAGSANFLLNALTIAPPLVFCFFFAGRPMRIGLAMTGVMLGALYFTADDERIVESRRTYFGLLRVMQSQGFEGDPKDPEEQQDFIKKFPTNSEGKKMLPPFPFTYLMHGTTYHGRNYLYGPEQVEQGYINNISRIATTYYHRYGPVGFVMEQWNWFKGKQNSFNADARLPAALFGKLAGVAGGTIPVDALTEVWSEPPYATIGLGTGTMASYSRPYQHMTYYEIDEVMRGFSLPENGGKPHFTYLESAIRRGVNLEIVMGDARMSLEPTREYKNLKNAIVLSGDFSKGEVGGSVYAGIPYDKHEGHSPNRESFYKAINVDAFSSDAIPVHLVTQQAIEIYLSKMTKDGVLCVHTSNRHMDLVRPVARIAMELNNQTKTATDTPPEYPATGWWNKYGKAGVGCMVGKDGGRKEYMGHFSSEYVMLYRTWTEEVNGKKEERGFGTYLRELRKEKQELIKAGRMKEDGGAPDGKQLLNSQVVWYDPYKDHEAVRGGRVVREPITINDSLWTDDYSYILGVIR